MLPLSRLNCATPDQGGNLAAAEKTKLQMMERKVTHGFLSWVIKLPNVADPPPWCKVVKTE
jgi:hypothetical protein